MLFAKRKQESESVDPLEQTINNVLSSKDADKAKKQQRQREFNRELKAVVEIIDKRLRNDYTDGCPRFGMSEITISRDVTNNNKVIEAACKVFEDNGWRIVEKKYGSANGFVLSFKTGFHIDAPEREPLTVKGFFKALGQCVFIVVVVITVLGLIKGP